MAHDGLQRSPGRMGVLRDPAADPGRRAAAGSRTGDSPTSTTSSSFTDASSCSSSTTAGTWTTTGPSISETGRHSTSGRGHLPTRQPARRPVRSVGSSRWRKRSDRKRTSSASTCTTRATGSCSASSRTIPEAVRKTLHAAVLRRRARPALDVAAAVRVVTGSRGVCASTQPAKPDRNRMSPNQEERQESNERVPSVDLGAVEHVRSVAGGFGPGVVVHAASNPASSTSWRTSSLTFPKG